MNSKITVVPFEQKHLEQIVLKENFDQSECPKTVATTAFTFMRGDKVIAVVGGFPFIPGVVHFWAMISKYVRECPIDFHKRCLHVIDWYEKNEKPRRIQFDVRCDYAMGQKWAESLGLQKEGVLRKWGPDGADYYLYARINPCLE